MFASDCDPKKGDNCDGTDGFDDIVTGAQVTVADNSGATVGLGELGQGTLAKNAPGWSFGEPFVCVFPVSVTEVPQVGDIYSVNVAGRDSISFTADDAQALELTLGD